MATPIPRNLPSEQMVIALINRDNNLNLSSSDVVVSEPRKNPTPTTITGTTAVRDTLADLLAVYGGNFKESAPITYRRLNADTIFAKVTTVIRPKNQVNTTDLIADINTLYGLALTVDDVVNELLDLNTLPYSLKVKFKDDNPAWIGSIPVIIKRMPTDIATVVTNNVLPVLRYPTGQSTLIQGDLYAYSRDFTANVSTLVDISFTSVLDPLVAILAAEFKPDAWVMKASASPFNLYGATVVYNGPVVDTYSTRRDRARCLVLQLSKSCNNMAGRLILHYDA
ncbi:hypothetical protein pEaSNUABM54_00036 [Erwinia phage pEa_SNUABM_54]|nr:hypothetical protein pEaSNUABM54_00036 [Erwinia phage pEa_SNUABM_54]